MTFYSGQLFVFNQQVRSWCQPRNGRPGGLSSESVADTGISNAHISTTTLVTRDLSIFFQQLRACSALSNDTRNSIFIYISHAESWVGI